MHTSSLKLLFSFIFTILTYNNIKNHTFVPKDNNNHTFVSKDNNNNITHMIIYVYKFIYFIHWVRYMTIRLIFFKNSQNYLYG